MEKILILTDSPVLSSGLARVGRELADRFRRKYQVAYAGWNHTNMPHKYPYYIYPLIRGSKNEPSWVATAIKNFKPDILLCIGDIWYFNYLEKVLKEAPVKERWLYLTLDAEPFYPEWIQVVNNFTKVFTQSQFAKEQINKIMPDLRIKAVHLGVDRKVFRPTNERKVWKDKFVVMINAYNCQRKNIPLSIEAFAEFSKDKDDVMMFMLTQPNTPEGYNLGKLVYWYGVQDKVVFEREKTRTHGVTDEEVNFYYNNSDVLLFNSTGEGFGLPVLESFAAKLPVIATDYSSLSELISNGRGIGIEPSAYVYGEYELKRALVSKICVSEELERIYLDRQNPYTYAYYQKMIDNAYSYARERTWDKTYKEIVDTDQKGDWVKC